MSIQNDQLDVLSLYLLRDLFQSVGVNRSAAIGDENYSPLVLELLAVIRDQLYCDNESRDC